MRYPAVLLLATFACLEAPAGDVATPPVGAGLIQMPSWPAVSPDGSRIVFEWRDDLWSASIKGGRASRLTAHPARDSYPRFSPDGATLYFCSTRSGALQLFSMPSDGGPATQHSFHSRGGTLEGLSPDGRTAILRGERDEPGFRPTRLIGIDLTREAPERYLFNATAQSSAWMPDGSRLLFCREGEALYRKGYRGPRASAIWSHDPASQSFAPLVKEDAEARWPMPWPDSRGFYYVSERDGTFNLWSRRLDGSEDRQLTHFTDDGVMLPALSADGSTLVFRRGFDLWRHHPETDSPPEKILLWQAADLPDHTTEVRDVAGTVDADFSPSGLEIAFGTEGELWTMDTVLREPNRLTHTDGREAAPLFSKDGQYLYFTYDDGLERNLWRISRKNPDEFWWRAASFTREQVSFGPEPKSGISISPDGSRLAWVASPGTLTVANPDGSDPQVIFRSWNPPTYDWSPDGEWIVFAAQDHNFNRDIYVIRSDGSGEPFNISRHPDFEGSPRWSPDGGRIAFIGRRLNDEMGLFYVDLRFEEAVRSSRERREREAEEIMRDDPLYQPDEGRGNPEPDEDPAETAEIPGHQAPPPAPARKSPALRIDFDGLSERVVRLDTRGIEPERMFWTHDGDAILFQSRNSTNDTLYRIEAQPGARMESIADHRGVPIRDDPDGALYWIVDRAPAVLKKGKLKRFNFKARLIRDRTAHQRLGYRLVWRTLRDRFYDGRMNGRDWDAMRTKYEEAAAKAPDSRTFDRVISMLLGELNASHLTFVSETWPKGWENEGAEFQTTRHLGIRFHREGPGDPLRVGHVITGSPADHCQPPIRAGDTIVRINGRRVDSSMPLHRFMNGRMDRRIQISIRDAGGTTHEHELEPITYAKAAELAKEEAITDNRRRVEEWSAGRLGYVHINRMYWDEFEKFERQIYAAGHGKDGLVIDIRDNGGGFITDHLLTILCQPRHALTIPRDGNPGYPQDRKVYASWHKPLVVLCNQNSYSNAEIFAHAIKTLGRGKLVGMPTAGGVISAGKDRILDAGTLRVPFRGWFLTDSGEDMEMNGAVPDILVESGPGDTLHGRDPQLNTAVETLLGDVAQTVEKPFMPKYRNR